MITDLSEIALVLKLKFRKFGYEIIIFIIHYLNKQNPVFVKARSYAIV